MRKVVLIISYEFFPFNRPSSGIGAQRPYQLAKYLTELQWAPIILCSDYRNRYALEPSGNWKDLVTNLIQNHMQNWDRDSPLVIPLPSLKWADWLDKMWLSKVQIDSENGSIQSQPGIKNAVQRSILTAIKQFRGDHSQSWQSVALWGGKELIEQGIKIDLMILEHGPDAALYIGIKLQQRFNIPFIVDFRDPVLQPLRRLIRPLYKLYLKKRIINHAKAVINVNPAWVEMDSKDFKKPTFLITNGYDEKEFESDVLPYQEFVISYVGNISFPSNVSVFFEGMKLAKVEYNVPVKFVYRGNSILLIKSKIEKYGLTDSVDIRRSVDRKEAVKIMCKSAVLILFSLDSKSQADPYLKKGYYPAKVFEYFATGNPILTVPGDNGILDELLKINGYDKPLDNPENVAARISEYYQQWLKTDIRKMGNKPNEHSRRNQTAKLNQVMQLFAN